MRQTSVVAKNIFPEHCSMADESVADETEDDRINFLALVPYFFTNFTLTFTVILLNFAINIRIENINITIDYLIFKLTWGDKVNGIF